MFRLIAIFITLIFAQCTKVSETEILSATNYVFFSNAAQVDTQGHFFYASTINKEDYPARYNKFEIRLIDLNNSGKTKWILRDSVINIGASKIFASTDSLIYRTLPFVQNEKLVRYLECYSIDTGQKLWEFEVGKSEFTVGRHALTLGRRQGIDHVLLATSDTLWSNDSLVLLPHRSVEKELILAVKVGEDPQTFVSLNPENGRPNWAVDIPIKHSFWLQAYLYNSYVILTDQEETMACLNADNGRVLWKQDISQLTKINNYPVCILDDVLIIRDDARSNARLIGVDVKTGDQLWVTDQKVTYNASVTTYHNKIVVVGRSGYEILFLDPRTGENTHKMKTPDEERLSGDIAIHEETIYYAKQAGGIYAQEINDKTLFKAKDE